MRSKLSRRLLLGGAMVLCSYLPASAADNDPMQGFYDNTVIVSVPNFGDFKTVYAADHTFITSGPMGLSKGTWTYADNKVCRTQVDPAPPPGFPNPNCELLDAHQVGDAWQIEAMGQKFDAKLVAGKQL
jgi:hypothetical protein